MRVERLGFRVVVHDYQNPISPKQEPDDVNDAAPQKTSGNDLFGQPCVGDPGTTLAHGLFLNR
jgi:hypothetical protein